MGFIFVKRKTLYINFLGNEATWLGKREDYVTMVNKARGAQIHWGSLFGKSHNALGYSTFRCYPDLGVLQIGIRAKVIENQAQRIHRHCQLFKKRDEREPMFLHAHDPDYVPEPIYPEYIPWADPEEDPEEYEDDEIEDGPVDYPMDGGDDRDDDDDDSSGDDADGEDEDDEGRREKEEALAPADSAIVLYLNYVRPQASIIPSTRGIDPAEEVPEIAPMTMGEVNNRVTELAELHEQDTQFRGVCVSLLRAIRAQSSPFILLARQSKQSQPFVFVLNMGLPRGKRVPQSVNLHCIHGPCVVITFGDLAEIVPKSYNTLCTTSPWVYKLGELAALPLGVTHQELQTYRDHVYAHETHLWAHQTQLQLQGTLIQTQHQAHETRFQMQHAELLALREQQRRARQPGPKARIPDHQDASGDADSHI
ncbi:hypothetical protein Tco_0908853 [Tanacetum coccineum]|uniref:Uncharacterized protein n=1 Tax=Tanacetum coccineum TaxID=301880 RepID=A0ABQ5CQG8_9ASTR